MAMTRALAAFWMMAWALSLPALAQDRLGVLPRDHSCRDWLNERADARRGHSLQFWLLGFIASPGATEPPDPPGLDAAAIWYWVDNYCRVRPMDGLGQAAAAFLAGRRG
jgi:hypothetical protein